MYKNILIPTDGSELANKAVEHGITLAKAIGAKITFMTTSLPFQVFTLDSQVVEETSDQYKERIKRHANSTLSTVATKAKAAGVPCHTVHVEHEHIYQAIIDSAKANDCDLITMASHGRRGVSALVLGSETVKVLTHSTIPVLVHR
jgi:nucleotide-binding universal stress UspA family protein